MTISPSAVALCLTGLLILPALPHTSAEPLGRTRHAFVLLQEDDPANPDAPKPVEGEPDKPAEPAQELKITITAVQGFAQVKQAADEPWVRAKVGMELNPGADVRTNVRSVVQIKIEPGQTITLDRLGTIKIIEAVKQGNTVKTDVGMRYGRTSYQVEADKEEHDAKLHTPGTVMAIRGTGTINQSDAYTESTTVITGQISNTDKLTKTTYSVNAMGKATVTSSEFNPAQHAMNQTENNPRGKFAGLDRSEHQILRDDPTDRFAQRSATPGVANTKQDEFNDNFQTMVQPMFQSTAMANSMTNGLTKSMANGMTNGGSAHGGGPSVLHETTMQLTLFWSGSNVNLNFSSLDAANGLLSPSQLVVRPGTSLAGIHSGDDIGGPSSGVEQVSYGSNIFGEDYKLTVKLNSTGTANAQVQGTVNGQSMTNPGQFTVDPANNEFILIANPVDQTIIFEPGM